MKKEKWFIVKTVCLFLIAGLLICCGGCQENPSVTSSEEPIIFPSGIAYDEEKDILLQYRLNPSAFKFQLHYEDYPEQPLFEEILAASTHIVTAKYLGCVYRDQTQKQFKDTYECWFDLQEVVCGEPIEQRFCFRWDREDFGPGDTYDLTTLDRFTEALSLLEIGQTYLLFLAEKQNVFYDEPFYSLIAETFLDLRMPPNSGFSYRHIRGLRADLSWDEFWALIDLGWSPATELTTSNIGAYLKTNDLSKIIAGSPEIRRLKILEKQKDSSRNIFQNTQNYTVEIVSDFKSEFPLDRKTVTVPAGSVEVGKEYIMMFSNKEFTDPYGNKYENRDLSSKHSIRPISEEETIRKIIAQQAAKKAETS